ncbi:MAG: GxxExxY protein [Desulfosalsimonadaceae bacterium]
MDKDPLTGRIIGCAIAVHRSLGPGLLESAYQQCMAHELHLKGVPFQKEHPMPLEYKGIHLNCGYRIDLLVDGQVVVELKSVDNLLPVHFSQILTYMKLADVPTGLLINFNVTKLANGIERLKL